MKKAGTFWVTVFVASAALAQINYPAISNLNQPSTGYGLVGSGTLEAVSFTTGNATSWLSGVSVSLSGSFSSAGGSAGDFSLSLYSDSSGLPGSSLATLTGDSFPASGVYIYTNAVPLMLSTNTTYWIVPSTDGSTNAFYEWDRPDNNKLEPVSIWTSRASAKINGTNGWQAAYGIIAKFSVAVSIAPPPISIFQPIVLTYSMNGLRHILQENADPSTTNWVTATNAIQLSTVNTNQAVFIVPPTGQQMFYRLRSQSDFFRVEFATG